jgi:hypothetical protein
MPSSSPPMCATYPAHLIILDLIILIILGEDKVAFQNVIICAEQLRH